MAVADSFVDAGILLEYEAHWTFLITLRRIGLMAAGFLAREYLMSYVNVLLALSL